MTETRRGFLQYLLSGLAGTAVASDVLENPPYTQPEEELPSEDELAKRLFELERRVIVDFGSHEKFSRAWQVLKKEHISFEAPVSYGYKSPNYRLIIPNYIRIYLEKEHNFRLIPLPIPQFPKR